MSSDYLEKYLEIVYHPLSKYKSFNDRFKPVPDISVKLKNEVSMSEVKFTQWDHPTVKNNDAIVSLFPERLMMFLSEFSDLLNVKNKAYGNSALEPLNVFSKASSSEVILQQIDHKLSRLKNSNTPSKNDVIDLMGYLTLYCLDQSWLDLQDLHK